MHVACKQWLFLYLIFIILKSLNLLNDLNHHYLNACTFSTTLCVYRHMDRKLCRIPIKWYTHQVLFYIFYLNNTLLTTTKLSMDFIVFSKLNNFDCLMASIYMKSS